MFISVLQEELGSRFTSEAAEALKKGFAGMVQSISKSLKYEECVVFHKIYFMRLNVAFAFL